MTRKVTVMNYLEVVGSIAHFCNNEYKNFFENYANVEEEEREDFVRNCVEQGGLSDFKLLDGEVLDFLDLPENNLWFICTFDNEYIENL